MNSRRTQTATTGSWCTVLAELEPEVAYGLDPSSVADRLPARVSEPRCGRREQERS
jgi:hypothetical protein